MSSYAGKLISKNLLLTSLLYEKIIKGEDFEEKIHRMATLERLTTNINSLSQEIKGG